jgi:hypothetical protein
MEEVKEYALSNDDINKILDPDTKVFAYPEFAHMRHITDAFDELGRCVFLFLTKSASMGHWLCMFLRDGHIEYFDSYGEKPEAQREWVSEEQLESLGEGEPYLWDLLKASGIPVYYSTHPYQKDKDDINTCGRWCVARLVCKDMNNHQFFNLVRQQMKEEKLNSPDDWVAAFTHDILGK